MKVLKRHAVPGKFHWEPFETQWHFEKTSGTVVVYIQISTNEQKPRWARLGSIFEVAFKDKFNDEEFISKCVKQYQEWLDATQEVRED